MIHRAETLRQPRLGWRVVLFFSVSLGLAGCTGEAQEGQAAPPQPAEVGIVTVRTENVSLTSEYAGRTAAFETSEVRPQVSGLVQQRLFEEGAEVAQGEVLYQIDPGLFEAAVAEETANVANAKAVAERARIQAERLRPLAQQGVTSAQSFTDADAVATSASAAQAQAEARLRTAEINLRYARVTAPISGRIGRSLFTTGTLVAAGQAEPLATIQRLDPIFVDIQQSSASLIRLRRALSEGETAADSADVRLKLEDGSDYPLTGELQFTEVTVAPDTGTVTLRAHFPNPDGLLLPGMYVRAVLSQAKARDAVLVPQQGVTRNPNGEASALVVIDGDKVERRTVEIERAVGNRWLVTKGLEAGDRLIVEGANKAKPGSSVKPVPASGPELGQQETPVAQSSEGATL
ncbi:efflux RND transporter periplasmic adaptor subunit [Aureimonas psammosilenae]|uniref:efflux RND transporter periplasmic adaptor subunit n=1 Tax=Aureimonas psammosilenae TaxID=2495496 RepID=UPI00126116E9|nr:efflux RND transporter periplasmic adaptor subunit [Aureimonas psammosilenae]